MEQNKKYISKVKPRYYFMSKSIVIYSAVFIFLAIIGLVRLFTYQDYGWVILLIINLLVFLKAFNYLLVDQEAIYFKTFFKSTVLNWKDIRQVKNNFPYITLLPVSLSQEKKFQDEFLNDKFENDYDQIQLCPKILLGTGDIIRIIRNYALDAKFDEGIGRLFQDERK